MTDSSSRQPDRNKDIKFNEIIRIKISIPTDDTIEKNISQPTDTVDKRKLTFKENKDIRYLAWQGLFLITREGEQYLKCNLCLKETYLLEEIDQRCPRELHLPKCEYSILRIPKSQGKKLCQIEYNGTKIQYEMYQENRVTTSVIALHPNNRKNILQYVKHQVKTQSNWSPNVYDLFTNLNFVPPKKKLNTEDNALQELYMSNNECAICLINMAQVIFLPCGHLKTCKSCSKELTNCPVCRMIIERRITKFKL